MTTFDAQLLGRTEKALNAILDRLLAGPGLTEHQWIALTLTVNSGGGTIAQALKVGDAEARQLLVGLAGKGLVTIGDDGTATPTEHGVAQWRELRAATVDIMHDLWGDLPAADLDTAGRVLTTILGRANTLLPA
ncbi:MarR family winged helix-turn-helix transcriptional regulator [Dactylosporangium sp. CS-047395]|uniref:MarR family winged helix-turn-helix transcriptional regulator n=1 Tax=Dactylosporangium sp. CS-047395 TaxID=3239936 RepID=UPI003D8C26E3